MLEVSDIILRGNDKTGFAASRGTIVLIAGKKSAERTHILDALCFQYPAEIRADGTDLKTPEEQNRFVFEHVSYVLRSPVYDENRTIFEHAHLMKDLYHTEYDVYETAEYFGIQDCLDLYYSDLNKEQKKLASVLCALIKEPDILILEDPLSSLTPDGRKKLIRFLRKYKETHAVIIAGSYPPEEADAIWQISEGTLLLMKEDERKENILTDRITKNNIDPKLFQNDRKRWIVHSLFTALVSALLIMSMCLVHLPLRSMDENSWEFSRMFLEENQLIVYRSLQPDGEYTMRSFELPLSEDDLRIIQQTEGITHVSERFDCRYIYSGTDEDTIILKDGEETYALEEPDVFWDIQQSLYSEHDSFETLTVYSYGDEGVWISDDLARKLLKSSEYASLNSPVLRFAMRIPVYSAEGAVKVYGDEKEYAGRAAVVRRVSMELPVRGILKTGGDQFEQEDSAILIPDHIFKEQMNMTVYPDEADWHMDDMTWEFILTDQKQTHEEYYPLREWKPDAYTATVNVRDLPWVITDLKKHGLFSVSSIYDVSGVSVFSRNTVQMIRLLAVLCGIIYLIADLFFRLKSFREGRRYIRFLYQLGLSREERIGILRQPLFRNAVFSTGMAAVIFFGCAKILELAGLAKIFPHSAGVILLFLIPVLMEYAVSHVWNLCFLLRI